MFDMANFYAWWRAISRQARERDIRQQIAYNNMRKASRKYITNFVADHIPARLLEFLEILMGSLLGFWTIGALLKYVLHINPLYTLLGFGLLYSVQATYYKYRLSADPNYKIPKCKCAGRSHDNMESVLQSKAGTILGIPNSIFATMFYFILSITYYLGFLDIVTVAAILAFCMSVYLSYVMVFKIGSLCEICINISAVNLLILLHVLF